MHTIPPNVHATRAVRSLFATHAQYNVHAARAVRLCMNRETTLYRWSEENNIYIDIGIKQVKLDDRKVSHVRDGRHK